MKNILGSPSLLALLLALTGCEHTPLPKKPDPDAGKHESGVSTSQELGSSRGSIAALDIKNGFRDTKFGDSVNQYLGMIETKSSKDFSDDPAKEYSRKGDKLKLGDADLQDIFYLFHQGRLTRVQLWIDGTHNSDKVLEALKYAYGPPAEINGFSCSWTSKKVFMYYNPFTDYTGKKVALVEVRSLEMEKEE